TYTLVNDADGLTAMLSDLALHKTWGVDTETTGLDNRTAGLVGLCLSGKEGKGYYVAIGHTEGPNLPLETVRTALLPLLEEDGRRLVFHNARYDLTILKRHGLLPRDWAAPGKLVDTMIAAFLCNAGSREISLDSL